MVLGTSYKAGVFEAEFGDGSKLGLEIEYVVEDEPLGTGGGIANVGIEAAARHRDGVQRRRALRLPTWAHCWTATTSSEADVTLHLVRVGDPRAFGCVPTDADGGVTGVPGEDAGSAHRSDQRRLLRLPTRGHRAGSRRAARCRLSARCFPQLLSDGLKVCGYVDATYWRDMGTPDDFVRGSADLVRGIAPSPALEAGIAARCSCTTVRRSRPARC